MKNVVALRQLKHTHIEPFKVRQFDIQNSTPLVDRQKWFCFSSRLNQHLQWIPCAERKFATTKKNREFFCISEKRKHNIPRTQPHIFCHSVHTAFTQGMLNCHAFSIQMHLCHSRKRYDFFSFNSNYMPTDRGNKLMLKKQGVW